MRAPASPSARRWRRKAGSTSKSAVSRTFVERTRQALGELMSRRLDDVRLAAMMLDGLELQGRTNIVALGITTEGVKIPSPSTRPSPRRRPPRARATRIGRRDRERRPFANGTSPTRSCAATSATSSHSIRHKRRTLRRHRRIGRLSRLCERRYSLRVMPAGFGSDPLARARQLRATSVTRPSVTRPTAYSCGSENPSTLLWGDDRRRCS